MPAISGRSLAVVFYRYWTNVGILNQLNAERPTIKMAVWGVLGVLRFVSFGRCLRVAGKAVCESVHQADAHEIVEQHGSALSESRPIPTRWRGNAGL